MSSKTSKREHLSKSKSANHDDKNSSPQMQYDRNLDGDTHTHNHAVHDSHDNHAACDCGHDHHAEHNHHDHFESAEHHHEHSDGCACNAMLNAAPLTDEEQALIAEDPAANSLARALTASFTFLKVAFAVLALFFIFDRFRSVREGEIMVIERFGAFITDDRGQIKVFEPGSVYFLFPAPIDQPHVLRIGETREIDSGSAFWPRVDLRAAASESLPNNSELDPLADGYNLTGDLNILHTRWKAKYRISDYRDYLLTTRDNSPAPILAGLIRNAVIRNFAGLNVDAAYYGDHRDLFEKITDDVRAQLADLRLGIDLDGNVANQSLLPPGPANAAFTQVTNSLSERKKLVDEARKNAATLLKEAETEALQINHEALQYQATVVADAKANAVRIRELAAQFPNDPDGLKLYLDQYRYDRLVDILSHAKVYLMRQGNNVLWTAPTPDYLGQ